jgi:isopentenyldiphosphate isomerase
MRQSISLPEAALKERSIKFERWDLLSTLDTRSSPLDTLLVTAEIFDVVNERDEVIGRAPRDEVHRQGLMHRATHVLVFNSRGQVFLQKRSLKKDRQPGLWDSSASGHVNCGEDYDACAVRELREEIGLELNAPLERLFKLAASPETDQEHLWAYRCEAEGPFELNAEEIERGEWFAPEEVTRGIAERPEEFASALLLIWNICKDTNAT